MSMQSSTVRYLIILLAILGASLAAGTPPVEAGIARPPPEITHSLGPNRGTTAPWSGGAASLDILCTGTKNGVKRRVRVAAKSFGGSANYALFGASNGTINGGAATVQGDVGTNGTLLFNGGPSVTGPALHEQRRDSASDSRARRREQIY